MAITVNELKQYCEEQIKKGNGEKEIMISNDDEGNGYHSLFYQFTDELEELKQIQEFANFHDDVDINNIVVLGSDMEEFNRDFSCVIDDGTNIDMTKICGCPYTKTLDDCEKCLKYFDCYNVALANDILKKYEEIE